MGDQMRKVRGHVETQSSVSPTKSQIQLGVGFNLKRYANKKQMGHGNRGLVTKDTCHRRHATSQTTEVIPADRRAKRGYIKRIRKLHEGFWRLNHVILSHGQVMWTTSELAHPSPNYHTTPTGGRFSSR
ncbi:hypothetical protein TNCV_5043251 [Trichonephila clavipes]|nr:hypothetical protein TNCV_5043251 [Trichonephila clavipes]